MYEEIGPCDEVAQASEASDSVAPQQQQAEGASAAQPVRVSSGLLSTTSTVSEDPAAQAPKAGLNACAAEFVPGSSFAPKTYAYAPQDQHDNTYQPAYEEVISPDQSDSMYYQGYGAWDEQPIYEAGVQGPQHYTPNGYHPPEYQEMNGQQYGTDYAYMQSYGMEAGGQAYEANGNIYEQYDDGMHANGTMAHDSVYHALFDDQQSPIPAAAAQHNGWTPSALPAPQAQPAVTPTEAMMAVLSEQYPAYSKGSLRDILDLSKGTIEGALDMLARTEANAPKPDSGAHGKAAATPAQKPPTLDDTNFPSLSTGPSPKPSPEGRGSPPAAAKPPSADAAPPAKAAGKGFATAVQQPNQDIRTAAAFGMSGRGRPKVANGHAAPRLQNGAARPGGYGQGRDEPAVPWVETGEAVAAAYAKARQEARDYARLRNTCFQQATQAYLAGNKALAKELGGKGRAYAEQMQAAHAVAADAIYKQRNAHKAGGGLRLIDLHGLHAKEAVDVLRREIRGVRESKQGQPGTVRISVIVGTGHHTKGKHTPAKLPAAVQAFLEAEGLAHRQPTPGMLDIAV